MPLRDEGDGMHYTTFSTFARALADGRVLAGDVVYVAPALYAGLSTEDRGWLWRQALELRVQLVTDFTVDPPIVVHRRAADG